MAAVGIVGRKCGMTRVFDKSGKSIPVTVVQSDPNRIVQLKTKSHDGYDAIQVTVGKRRVSRVTKPLAGHYAKAGVEAGLGLWEFLLPAALTDEASLANYQPGKEITVDVFAEGQMVDVTGTSKGKGFAGTVKRYNFRTQDASHGNSVSHRVVGSTGQNQTPGRVFPGKKMPGQLGNVRSTSQNLEIIRVDAERNLLLIKGAVPGAPGGFVMVKPTVKSGGKQDAA